MTNLLKSVIQDLINDHHDQAAVTVHEYIVSKTQQIAGLAESEGKTLFIVGASRGPEGDGPCVYLELNNLTDDEVAKIRGADKIDLGSALQDLKYNDVDMSDVDEVVVVDIMSTKPKFADVGVEKPYNWLERHAAL